MNKFSWWNLRRNYQTNYRGKVSNFGNKTESKY